MKFKLLDPDCVPYKKYPTDAGYDLKSSRDIWIAPGETVMIGAGVAVEIPKGYVGDIRPRSSTSLNGLVLPVGTVDHGYTGEIGIIVINVKHVPVQIHRGDRIAQLVVTPCIAESVGVVDELPKSLRGRDGFGSTGR